MSTNITHPDMVRGLVKSGAVIAEEMTPNSAHLLHMAVGVSGEAGELMLAVAKYHFLGKELDVVNIIEELGDIEFYSEGLCQGIETTTWDELQPNIDEMGIVFPSSLLEACTFVTVHASEILDLVKKYVIYQKEVPTEDVAKHLTLMAFYMDAVRGRVGTSRQETLNRNIAKLSIRYDGLKYSDLSAQVRADKIDGE